MAKEKVSVQKGPINPNPKTLKTVTPKERMDEDTREANLRRSGQQCTLMTPKK